MQQVQNPSFSSTIFICRECNHFQQSRPYYSCINYQGEGHKCVLEKSAPHCSRDLYLLEQFKGDCEECGKNFVKFYFKCEKCENFRETKDSVLTYVYLQQKSEENSQTDSILQPICLVCKTEINGLTIFSTSGVETIPSIHYICIPCLIPYLYDCLDKKKIVLVKEFKKSFWSVPCYHPKCCILFQEPNIFNLSKDLSEKLKSCAPSLKKLVKCQNCEIEFEDPGTDHFDCPICKINFCRIQGTQIHWSGISNINRMPTNHFCQCHQ